MWGAEDATRGEDDEARVRAGAGVARVWLVVARTHSGAHAQNVCGTRPISGSILIGEK